MIAQARTTPARPAPAVDVIGARFAPTAATPNLVFTLEANDASDREIYAIALSCQVNIEPGRRFYDLDTRVRLTELLGQPALWSDVGRSIMWMERETLVPSFRGFKTFDLSMPATYDMEVAATRYFYSLSSGEVPLRFYFRGTIFYQADEGGLQMTPVPWDAEATYRLPVVLWKTMMDRYHPDSAWVRLRAETLTDLLCHQGRRSLPSIDATLEDLLSRGPAATTASMVPLPRAVASNRSAVSRDGSSHRDGFAQAGLPVAASR